MTHEQVVVVAIQAALELTKIAPDTKDAEGFRGKRSVQEIGEHFGAHYAAIIKAVNENAILDPAYQGKTAGALVQGVAKRQ